MASQAKPEETAPEETAPEETAPEEHVPPRFSPFWSQRWGHVSGFFDWIADIVLPAVPGVAGEGEACRQVGTTGFRLADKATA